MHDKPCPKCGHCPTCGRSNVTPYGLWPWGYRPPYPPVYPATYPYATWTVASHSYTPAALAAPPQNPLSTLTTNTAAGNWDHAYSGQAASS